MSGFLVFFCIHEYNRVYMSIHGYTDEYSGGKKGYTGVYKGIHGYTRVYMGKLGYIWVY